MDHGATRFQPAEPRTMIRCNAEGAREESDWVAVEQALTILLDGEEFATIVCTPVEIDELVYGFLASEGIIRRPEEVTSLVVDLPAGYARIALANPHAAGKRTVSKRFIGSCCGKSRQFYFHNDARTAKTSRSTATITPRQCAELIRKLGAASETFQRTGGLHNAAICTPDYIIAARSDIGRHNALDKIYGYCLLNGIPVKDAVIAFSGRLSSEVLLKIAKIGAGIVLSKSAPTTLAIELAHDLGITAVGFIRGGSLNVYAHPHRILCDQEGSSFV